MHPEAHIVLILRSFREQLQLRWDRCLVSTKSSIPERDARHHKHSDKDLSEVRDPRG
jgi:hypothetical protein